MVKRDIEGAREVIGEEEERLEGLALWDVVVVVVALGSLTSVVDERELSDESSLPHLFPTDIGGACLA
jgi:hypothetical protein